MNSATLCALCLSSVGLSAGPADRPNILVILADDLGYGDVGFNGCRDIPTPNLDALAASGATCTNGYSSHPFCSPMRAGLMTGRYQHRFGYETNVAYDRQNVRIGLPMRERTIADRLRKAGYRTWMIGKWHLGAAHPFHPLNRGFDHFFGFLGGGHLYFTVDTAKPQHEGYNDPLNDDHTATGFTGYLTDVLTDRAVEWVAAPEAKQNPWFLYLAYNAPHSPLQAPEELIQKFAGIEDKNRRVYAAMVHSVDLNVGRVLKTLEESGQRDNTVVFFLSDNGGSLRFGASNAPLRGQKGDVFEGGIRVPFAASWPGRIPPGTTYDLPVSSLDVTATAAHLAGAPVGNLEGVNLIPYFAGRSDGPPHDALFWRSKEGMLWAVRKGDQKLVQFTGGEPSVYDLAADVGEQNPLGEGDEVLQAAWDEWNAGNRPARFPAYRQYHELLKEFHDSLINN